MLRTPSAVSTLEDETDRLKLEVWLVETAALTTASRPSTLDELLERVFDWVLMAARSASMLEEEFERLRLEV